jgi:uncharacterized protein YeeX (DUF496 family)
MSEKLERFERLAEKRVTDVIKKMRLIGNLANKHNYEYTDEHVKQIIDALEDELRLLKSRFKEEKINEKPAFSFKR